MNLFLEKVKPDEWKKISQDVHMVTFGLERDDDCDRIDYALVVRNDKDMCGYATVIELDKNSVYMQHGGAFPSVSKTGFAVKCYFMMMNWLKENYTHISTRVLNKNIAMIKMAMAAGLVVNGVDCVDNLIFLNLCWKRG